MLRYLSTIIVFFVLQGAIAQCPNCGTDPNQPRNWLGTVNSDWNNPGNWQNGVVPGGLDPIIDATIYSNPPIISTGFPSTFVPDDIVIQNGGVLVTRANLTIDDDFIVRSGGTLQVEGGTVATDDDFNLCAGGNIVVTGGTLDNMPAGGSGELRVCTTTPLGQPAPTIVISGGSFVTTTTDTEGGVPIQDFLEVTGDGVYEDGDGNTILPVELISFFGEAALDGVILAWFTATEINNDRFEIQRSTNAIDFETIGIVKGAGTTNVQTAYQFKDRSPAAINYYRLKQIDFDGQFELLPTIQVDFTDFRDLYQAAYQPREHRVVFSSRDTIDEVAFYQPSGRLVFHAKEVDYLEVSTTGLPSGLYLMRIVDESIQSVEKFMIRR